MNAGKEARFPFPKNQQDGPQPDSKRGELVTTEPIRTSATHARTSPSRNLRRSLQDKDDSPSRPLHLRRSLGRSARLSTERRSRWLHRPHRNSRTLCSVGLAHKPERGEIVSRELPGYDRWRTACPDDEYPRQRCEKCGYWEDDCICADYCSACGYLSEDCTCDPADEDDREGI